MRRVVLGGIAAVAVLGATLLSGHDRVALAQSCLQYDVTGPWPTQQGNAYHPTFNFSQSGTSISGTATLPADEASRAGFSSNTGAVSGSLNRDSLDVTVSWQKADGGVSGRYRAIVTPTGERTGSLSAGDAGGNSWTGGGPMICVQTSSPPPTDTTPTNTPNTQILPFPVPGDADFTMSPQVVPNGHRTGTVEVTSSNGRIPAVVGESGTQSRARRTGEAVAACWLIGPGVINFSNDNLKRKLKSQTFLTKFDKLGATDQLRLCMLLVAIANDEDDQDVPLTTAAATCKTRPLTFTIKRKGKKTTSIKLSTKKPSKKNVRYTCSSSGGKLTIKAKRDAKGGLRKAVGKRLDMGVYRSPNAAPSDGNVAFKFKFGS